MRAGALPGATARSDAKTLIEGESIHGKECEFHNESALQFKPIFLKKSLVGDAGAAQAFSREEIYNY
jgi:hypothetical protein